MTRFARKGGVKEKKEDKKKIEEATNWNDMFKEGKEIEIKKNLDEKKKKHESELNKKIESDNFNGLTGPKKFDENFVLRKYSKLIDKEVLDEITEMKNKGKITHKEYLEQIIREGRSNQRRLDRKQERENKRVCFKCRKPGHSVSQCPDMEKDSEQGTGICYKCGSTEHSVNQCKVRLEPGVFPYAKCFICHEMGHITKQCPDNPRGLYPNGGCCKSCGSVEHYYRDCPEIQKQNLLNETKTAKKIKTFSNFEDISEDDAEKNTDLNKNLKKKKSVFFKK